MVHYTGYPSNNHVMIIHNNSPNQTVTVGLSLVWVSLTKRIARVFCQDIYIYNIYNIYNNIYIDR